LFTLLNEKASGMSHALRKLVSYLADFICQPSR
jgi:hypothetical protein